MTIWFVAALDVVGALGIIALLPAVPTPPAIGLVGAHQLGLLAAGLLVLGLLASEIAHRLGRPDKARDAPVPTPADKTESGAPAKTEGDVPPTGGVAAPVRPEHRGHT